MPSFSTAPLRGIARAGLVLWTARRDRGTLPKFSASWAGYNRGRARDLRRDPLGCSEFLSFTTRYPPAGCCWPARGVVAHLKTSLAERIAHRLRVDKTRRAFAQARNSDDVVAIASSPSRSAIPRSSERLNSALERFVHLCPADQLSYRAEMHRAAAHHSHPFHNDQLKTDLQTLCAKSGTD